MAKSCISHDGWLDPELILPYFRMMHHSIAVASIFALMRIN
jgi:uncharacterized protein YjhX (UPF0386 family)